jgi:hypothetical protein
MDDLLNRVRALEDQVRELCESTGTPYRLERPEVPDEVRALIEGGNRVEAVKRYVELTGADLREASRVVGQY